MKTYIASRTDGNGLADYYLKSEADKAIAKLKQQIEILQKEKKIIQDLYLGERDDCRIWASRAIHNKRKRCLNNAWWCLREEFYAEDCHCERWVDWAIKWYKRWLELADKFKEAK